MPVTKRIPEDQPFILRAVPASGRWCSAALLLFLVLLLGCPLGLAASESGEVGPVLALLGIFVLFFGAVLGLQLYLLVSGGPVLAAGPQGLWIKTRPHSWPGHLAAVGVGGAGIPAALGAGEDGRA